MTDDPNATPSADAGTSADVRRLAPAFAPGDIVNFTVRGARVDADEVDGDGFRYVQVVYGDRNLRVFLDLDAALTVERVVPAEWPPQAGDLWRDRHGELWFFYCNPSVMKPEPMLLGRTSGGARWTDDIAGLLRDGNAPWVLVRREGVGRG